MKESISVKMDESFKEPVSVSFELLNSHLDAITPLLDSYYFLKRGKVHHVKILADTLKHTRQREGQFTVGFDVNYTYGCQDLTFNENETMVIQFIVGEQEITFTGEQVLERGMDEL